MDAERWRRISDLFHSALDLPPAEREAFLTRASADASDRDEVRSLLAAHDEGFLDTPAIEQHQDLLTDDASHSPGTTIGPYRIVACLGQGGMGVVYLAEDDRLGRKVALKGLPTALLNDPQLRQRLAREARAAAALTHPGIATIYSLEEFGGHPYIAREYVEGETLRDELKRGRLPIETVADIGLQIVRALAAAHAEGIVHRDLKPENVMRTADGRVKILDFGLASMEGGPQAVTNERLTQTGRVLGTPGYMSPEQLLGGEVDARSDLYSFGVLLHELAAGAHPFSGAPPAGAPPSAGGIPPELAAIVRRLLEPDRTRRYQQAREVEQALERFARRVSGATREGARPAPAPTLSPRWWWEFHQMAVSIVYGLMLYPVWTTRRTLPGRWGLFLFFALLVPAAVTANLRVHLWFTSRFNSGALLAQRTRLERWVRLSDWVFAAVLFLAGVLLSDVRSGVAALFIAVAVGAAVASVVVEPATAQSAFRRPRTRTGRGGS